MKIPFTGWVAGAVYDPNGRDLVPLMVMLPEGERLYLMPINEYVKQHSDFELPPELHGLKAVGVAILVGHDTIGEA